MKVLRVVSVIVLMCLAVAAQQLSKVSGKVLVKRTPVKVTIVLKQNDWEIRRTTSSVDGNYRFDNVPAGNYQIGVVSVRDGREVVTDVQEVSVMGNIVAVDFNLAEIKSSAQPGPTIRETVTVSAGESQPIEQVSKTVDVISAQEMRDRADFSLADTLRTIPGFRVAQLGGFGRTATIKTRGLRNQDTAILIDGIRFRDASAIAGDASPFLSDFTLTSVSKIEVLRGSGSSLYGTNAIGGTVDFQTPEARSGTHGQISGAIGGLGLRRFRGNLSHGISNGRFGVTAGLSRTVYTRGIDGQDDANNTNFQSRVDARPTSKTNISARIFISGADVRLNSSPDTIGFLPSSPTAIIEAIPSVNFAADANDPDSLQRSKFYDVQFSATHVIGTRFVLSGYYQGLKTDRRNDDGILGTGFQSAYTSRFDGTIHTANVHFNWNPVRQNTITAGYEFEKEKFGNTGSTPSGSDNFSTQAFQSSNTFYIQDQVSLLDQRLQLSGGFRAQSFSLQRPRCGVISCPTIFNKIASPPASYTGDGSAAYYFRRTNTKLRAHVGNGYRVPSLYERFGSYFFFNTFFPLGNPALKPERSIALDGGVEQSFADGAVKLFATYFYTRIKNEITYLPTDDFNAPSYYNFDKHFSRGVELSGTVKPTRSTDIFVSYTFTNSDVRNFRRPTFPVGPVSSRDRRAYGVPDNQFTVVATQRFKRLWVNFDFLATSSYIAPIFSNSTFATYIYRFAGNRRGDLTAGYTFGFRNEKQTLRLFGTIENVFNQEYYESGFRTAKSTARIGLAYGF